MARKSATIKSAPQPARTQRRTTASQRLAMLTWMERPGHFAMLTHISNEELDIETRRNAFKRLGEYVNRVCPDILFWTQSVAKCRFGSYLSMYHKAAEFLASNERNAETMDKVEKKCPFFDRLDRLVKAHADLLSSPMRVITPILSSVPPSFVSASASSSALIASTPVYSGSASNSDLTSPVAPSFHAARANNQASHCQNYDVANDPSYEEDDDSLERLIFGDGNDDSDFESADISGTPPERHRVVEQRSSMDTAASFPTPTPPSTFRTSDNQEDSPKGQADMPPSPRKTPTTTPDNFSLEKQKLEMDFELRQRQMELELTQREKDRQLKQLEAQTADKRQFFMELVKNGRSVEEITQLWRAYNEC